MPQVMGTPFDRVQCPTATRGTGNIVVTGPNPGYMRPYDSGVRDGDSVTLLIEEGGNFELVEATAQNCTAQSCEFVRNLVRYSSVNGTVSQTLLDLKGAAHVSIVAGAADLNVHRGGTIHGDIVLQGDLTVAGAFSAPDGGTLPGPQGPQGEPGPIGPQGPQGDPGTVGPQGPQGAAGAAGPQGVPGPAGPAGADSSVPGPVGPQGGSGPQGAPGIQGAQGGQGPKGDTGAAGPQGIQGATGTQGATGPAGPNAVSANAGNQAKLGTDSLIFVPAPTSVKGVIDGSDAAAGNVGEVISSSVIGALPLTTLAARNVTQITLTPGDWNIGGVVIFAPTSTGPNAVIAALSQTAAALPSDTEVAQGTGIMQQIWASSMPSGKTQTTPTSLIRISTTTSKTIYLVAMASFGGGSVNVTGYISARRVR